MTITRKLPEPREEHRQGTSDKRHAYWSGGPEYSSVEEGKTKAEGTRGIPKHGCVGALIRGLEKPFPHEEPLRNLLTGTEAAQLTAAAMSTWPGGRS